ncbi:MAG TPA: hypothetical protein VEC57_20840 [Candidatus Limnocylindrales bacterium]|nr:hypothetical protein [Candidatus Limnocylindrales bacterium]
MTPLEFDHQLRKRLLSFRQTLNRSAQCMNMASDALGRALVASKKSTLRLQASTVRLVRCMEFHGL